MSKYKPIRKEVIDEICRKQIEEQEGTGRWLNRSVRFDNAYKLRGESLEKVKEIGNLCKIPKRTDSRQKLNIIIANLLRHHEWRPVEIALKTKEATMSPLVHKLEDHGFLDIKRGNELIARNSRMWPTPKLMDYFNYAYKPDLIFDPPFSELVIFKDKNGNPTAYKDTARTNKIKNILKKANEVNRNAEIMCRRLRVSTALVAIFHRKSTLYGRLHTKGYHHYQGFSDDTRAKITINGEKVVELDFSCFNPHLLYAREGKQLEGDAYSIIPNVPAIPKFIRDFLKKCLLPLLNAKGGWVKPKDDKSNRKVYWRGAEHNAEGGINLRIGKNARCRRWLNRQGIRTGRQIIDLFKDGHGPIAHHFCADKELGLKVMNQDASIALDVVEQFTSKGIPILPIHDSFIVQEQYREELYNIMDKVYKKHTACKKHPEGFSCPVK